MNENRRAQKFKILIGRENLPLGLTKTALDEVIALQDLSAKENELIIKSIEYVKWCESDSPKGETVQGVRHRYSALSQPLTSGVI